MIVINFWGGPNSGKSTQAAGLFHRMKADNYSVEVVNEYAKKTYGLDENLDLNVYSDTDSCYFTVDPILKKTNHNFLTESGKVSHEVYKLEKDIEEVLNEEIMAWASKRLNSVDPRFVFKREAICDSGIFIQKKRYILHVIDNEGFEVAPEKQTKYVGVEIKKTEIPIPVRNMLIHGKINPDRDELNVIKYCYRVLWKLMN